MLILLLIIFLILFTIYFRKWFFNMLVFFYSIVAFQKINGIYYIPIFFDKKLLYIPIVHKKCRFWCVDAPVLSDYDKRALFFITNFSCKLNIETSITVFDMIDHEEKKMLISEL